MANVLHVKGHGGASYIETDMEKKLADRKKAKQLYLDIQSLSEKSEGLSYGGVVYVLAWLAQEYRNKMFSFVRQTDVTEVAKMPDTYFPDGGHAFEDRPDAED